jgi:hypothetical protein
MAAPYLQAGEVRIHTTTQSRQLFSVYVPRVLVCSQLPATVTFPMGIALQVVEQQAAGRVARSCGVYGVAGTPQCQGVCGSCFQKLATHYMDF